MFVFSTLNPQTSTSLTVIVSICTRYPIPPHIMMRRRNIAITCCTHRERLEATANLHSVSMRICAGPTSRASRPSTSSNQGTCPSRASHRSLELQTPFFGNTAVSKTLKRSRLTTCACRVQSLKATDTYRYMHGYRYPVHAVWSFVYCSTVGYRYPTVPVYCRFKNIQK